MNVKEKYYNWILNNPKWLKIPRSIYIRLKDDIINDPTICEDLLRYFPEISTKEPQELLKDSPLRFWHFIRTFMADLRWKLKYGHYSITYNKEENEKLS